MRNSKAASTYLFALLQKDSTLARRFERAYPVAARNAGYLPARRSRFRGGFVNQLAAAIVFNAARSQNVEAVGRALRR